MKVKAIAKSLVVSFGVFVVLGTYLPWVRVGPLFLRGYQGDGKIFAVAGLLAVSALLAYFLKPQARKYAWLSCIGGFIAWFVSLANFISIMMRTLMDASISMVYLTYNATTLHEGVSKVAAGPLTLPGDLFFLALTHQERLPAFVEGLGDTNNSVQEILDTLSSMDQIPYVGGGLILSLVVGSLVFLFGCIILFGGIDKRLGRSDAGRG
jgi:hypothetical protein